MHCFWYENEILLCNWKQLITGGLFLCKDQFVYVPSQWETTLHCNVVSYCLGAYTKMIPAYGMLTLRSV